MKMDEIEYKLKSGSSVLLAEAVDKLCDLISTERRLWSGDESTWVLQSAGLRRLGSLCAGGGSAGATACCALVILARRQDLSSARALSLALSTLTSTQSPTETDISAVVWTVSALLVVTIHTSADKKFKCPWSLKSPAHPMLILLQKAPHCEQYVIKELKNIINSEDQKIRNNSIELIRPVVWWLACSGHNPQHAESAIKLLVDTSNSNGDLLLRHCLGSLSWNTEGAAQIFLAAVHNAENNPNRLAALAPITSALAVHLLSRRQDPRLCFEAIQRCQTRSTNSLTVALLAQCIPAVSPHQLKELMALCVDLITSSEDTSLSTFMAHALSLQWLHRSTALTANTLPLAARMADECTKRGTNVLSTVTLRSNPELSWLAGSERTLSLAVLLLTACERAQNDEIAAKMWIQNMDCADDTLCSQIWSYCAGILLMKSAEKDLRLSALRVCEKAAASSASVAVQMLPILLRVLAVDNNTKLRAKCLQALPPLAKHKENVPYIVRVLGSLRARGGVPTSSIVLLYGALANHQARCLPYLMEALGEVSGSRNELHWESEVAKALAVSRLCEERLGGATLGTSLVGAVSSLLGRSGGGCGNATAVALGVRALRSLWQCGALAPPPAWKAVAAKLTTDSRPIVQKTVCELLSCVPELRAKTPEYDALVSEAARHLWRLVADGTDTVVIAACAALANYELDDYTLKDVPAIYRGAVRLPSSFCKTPVDAARRPEDVLDYVPCEIWGELFRLMSSQTVEGAVMLCTALVEREVRLYRPHVYQRDRSERVEPKSADYLPHRSLVRGILDTLRTQVVTPSHTFSETSLLAILRVVSAEYTRPLPPLDMCFLHDCLHKGSEWRRLALLTAARQAGIVASARTLIDNYLRALKPQEVDESDLALLCELLPALCRTTPPNSLRGPITMSIERALQMYVEPQETGDETERPLLIVILNQARICVASERIHDANRTLLAQILHDYFNRIPINTMAWRSYTAAMSSLSAEHIERTTSPSGWWETTTEMLRRATDVRAQCVSETGSLVWINDLVDAYAHEMCDHDYCLERAYEAASTLYRSGLSDNEDTQQWLLQLLARAHLATTQSESEAGCVFVCEIVLVCVCGLSGVCTLVCDKDKEIASKGQRTSLFPLAVALLLQRPAWKQHVKTLVEWVVVTRDRTSCDRLARACQQALLQLRHRDTTLWMRLENYIARDCK